MSRGSKARAEATRMRAAAPYSVAGTPAHAAIGPASTAPTGIAMTDPTASYDDTLASLSGGMFLASATVQRTIMISRPTPRTNAAQQISGTGHSMPSAVGVIAMLPPVSTMNSIGRRGVNRSATSPPAISPRDSAPVIVPQAAGPPRCALATTGPSTLKPPYQAISTTANCAMTTHSQVRERTSDQPSASSRYSPGWLDRLSART